MILLLTACRSMELAPVGLPEEVEAAVLLATGSDASVTVQGAVLSGQHLDLDGPEDDRDGFRYRIRDGQGEVLYERSTNGPPLVQAFLGYWGDVGGIDVLSGIPNLGRFFVHVPLIEGGETVDFQYREANGYIDAGSYDLSRLASDDQGLDERVTDWTTLHDSGDPAKRFDLAILSDGYLSSEMDVFAGHAEDLTAELLGTPPFDALAPLINVHRIDVASNEQGAGFDCPTCGPKDTAFGSIFAVEAINRLSGGDYDSRAMLQTEQWAIAQAASHAPWDLAIVLTHSERPAGLAVHVATASTKWPNWESTAVHELGHLIGLLGDEYVADACIRTDRMGLPVNVTDRPRNPPWAHWVEEGTPLPSPNGTPGIGAHQRAFNCSDLYRPRRDCLMNSGSSFCPVCREQLIRRVLRFADPVDGLEQRGGRARTTGPVPVAVDWLRDGEIFASSAGEEWVRVGSRPFRVRATYDTDRVRADPYGDLDYDAEFSADSP